VVIPFSSGLGEIRRGYERISRPRRGHSWMQTLSIDVTTYPSALFFVHSSRMEWHTPSQAPCTAYCRADPDGARQDVEPPMDSQILYSMFAVLRAWMVGLILERELLQRPPPAAWHHPYCMYNVHSWSLQARRMATLNRPLTIRVGPTCGPL